MVTTIIIIHINNPKEILAVLKMSSDYKDVVSQWVRYYKPHLHYNYRCLTKDKDKINKYSSSLLVRE